MKLWRESTHKTKLAKVVRDICSEGVQPFCERVPSTLILDRCGWRCGEPAASSLPAALAALALCCLALRLALRLALARRLACACLRLRRLRRLLEQRVRHCAGLGLCLRPHHGLCLRLCSLHGGRLAAESGRVAFGLALHNWSRGQRCSPLPVRGRLLEIRSRAWARLPSRVLARQHRRPHRVPHMFVRRTDHRLREGLE